MSEQVGTVVAGRYELSEVIGKGGQGLVYLALDRDGGGSVAVKMLTGPAARDRQFVERLRREVDIMKVLAGTCAVSAIDLCVSPHGYPCLIMERLVGMDLEQYVRRQQEAGHRIELRDVVERLEPIVDTLERAHAAGIIHRDLKPANVFLIDASAGGGVRLLDFGMAKLRQAAPLTAVGTVLGSPAYMAPEVWQGLSDRIDGRADVYSLAVLVYRVLGGQLPFDAPTLPEQLRLVTTAERPSLRRLRPDLPRAVDPWMARGLAVDPSSRFADVRVMWEALRLCTDAGRRGLFGFSPKPLASAWKAARAAVDRIAGLAPSAPTDSSRTAASTRAEPEPPADTSPAASPASRAAAPTRPGAASASAPPGRHLPKIPPPPPPRPKSGGAPTVMATPEARDADDAKTLLYIPKAKVRGQGAAPASEPEPEVDSSVKGDGDGSEREQPPSDHPGASGSGAPARSDSVSPKGGSPQKKGARKRAVSTKKKAKPESARTSARKKTGGSSAAGSTTARKKAASKKATSKKSTKKKSTRSAS